MPAKRPSTPGIGNLTSTEIRSSFQDFFAARGHTIVPSSSLVPGKDPTLLFTNAGMVQFKDVFLGTGKRAYSRAVNSQKCMRVAGKHNDLEDVGTDDSHHTFFEMLGNWSFGDYYKQEAISWAWELLTEKWGLAKERIHATCFEDELGEIPRDDEAAEIWARQPGFDASQIHFFGRDENFWEMADTGPSGPDSEIHYDLGSEHCNKQQVEGHVCAVNGDCNRFLELWNLVFIQYNRTGPTALEPLPERHVDTGMGFERIVSILQGVKSNYQTDLFLPIFDRIQEIGNHGDEERRRLLTPYRVISDHGRAAAFLIADGVVPGNTGRNYVCRMIIRRASRFGGKAGFTEPFLADIAETVIQHYGEAYPELLRGRDAILSSITTEERRFQQTVDIGLAKVNQLIHETASRGERVIPGDQAFELYATYGMPLEITRDVAREVNLEVDDVEFQRAMDGHRIASGAGLAAGDLTQEDARVYQQALEALKADGKLKPGGVAKRPYGEPELTTSIVAMFKDAKPVPGANSGDPVAVVTPETPFYVEAGGQVADRGSLVSQQPEAWEIRVEGTFEPVEGLVLHIGTVVAGEPRVGDETRASIDADRRWDIMRNHTATHLLHAALRETLGEHARQAGSLVAPDRLRFDFTHPEAVSEEQLRAIEDFVNQAVLGDLPVVADHKPLDEAIESGAIALFGEAYDDTVRTIRIGDNSTLSFELCGGTHVPATGVIGPFLVVSEGSVGAGLRRIEAITGRRALRLIQRRLDTVRRLSEELGTPEETLSDRVHELLKQQDAYAKEILKLRQSIALQEYETIESEQVAGVPLFVGQITEADAETLRSLADRFRSEHPTGVLVLGSIAEGRPALLAAVTQDLVARGLHAGEMIRDIAKTIGGGGGGKPTLAQAGGKEPGKLSAALDQAAPWVRSRLK